MLILWLLWIVPYNFLFFFGILVFWIVPFCLLGFFLGCFFSSGVLFL